MAEVQSVSTVEINDAIFCAHLKEVVRVTFAYPAILPHTLID